MALFRQALSAALALALLLTASSKIYALAATRDLPDAPQAAQPQTSAPATAPDQNQQAPEMTPEEKRKKAQEQLEQQEKQRVWAVVATFNTTANQKALPLSTGQKFQLFFKSAFDPWPFMLAAVLAGTNQAQNSFPQYGQGLQGYGKRLGASYGDYFIGNLMGNAVLASAFKEDPRYYQMGHGKFIKRALWASSGTVWCKRDNGTWGPNYANVIGNLVGTSISNVYYPPEERTVGGTISRGFSVTAQGIIGSEVIEFWPDIVRHHRRKEAEKLAKKGIGPNATPPPAINPPAPTPQP